MTYQTTTAQKTKWFSGDKQLQGIREVFCVFPDRHYVCKQLQAEGGSSYKCHETFRKNEFLNLKRVCEQHTEPSSSISKIQKMSSSFGELVGLCHFRHSQVTPAISSSGGKGGNGTLHEVNRSTTSLNSLGKGRERERETEDGRE